MNQLVNYQNSLCDVLTPMSPPATTADFILRFIMIFGVAAAIITAGILVKRSEKKNSEIQKEIEKQQDPKL